MDATFLHVPPSPPIITYNANSPDTHLFTPDEPSGALSYVSPWHRDAAKTLKMTFRILQYHQYMPLSLFTNNQI
jgi:hypothetical protein